VVVNELVPLSAMKVPSRPTKNLLFVSPRGGSRPQISPLGATTVTVVPDTTA
jgi:hypothetical protein